ncbi:molybdopterin-guanine dinucleotide biosynthesis protein MobA [Salmonella enterica subsp. enterica serovar Tafo]|nr:molybdopterin-guanine dinucleotide biosynthesis protein MobA [Salmonella enterica subsp. enterica serovar Onireke]EEF0876988.1 molybdopterin-guanine dinucleotide biosynthesis protein MobA [Salmonella enterica subsp. enterica serovar Tafo]
MAIFHLDFKIVKRSEGMTSVAKAAYHARTRITDDRIGEVFDFSHRTDLHGHIILAPVSAPSHIVESSSALWNEVERVERQNNGQTARYFDVAIPVELNNDDKKKLVAEYCQKNFVDKGMIADIAFHDLDGKNPHAHVMLTLKTITAAGFGKKDRSWNDKKIMIQWRESWATMANSYLEAIGSEERIDHRSLRTQCADALAQAEEAFSAEEKAFWLAKATETNRPAMQRVHRAKWNDKESQEQRAAEQAQRDQRIEEAKKVYTTFSELPLEIVVDVKGFTISVLPEPEEIVLPETRSGTSTNETQNHGKRNLYEITSEKQRPVPVAPASHTHIRGDKSKVSKVVTGKKPSVSISDSGINTILKKSSSKTLNRASNSAPERVKRKQATPRQDNIFKRFTALLVDFIKGKFIWAKSNKVKTDIASEEHDKHIAENYVFDEVLGHYISRAEYEKQAKFNQNDYKPTQDETNRFPSRLKQDQPKRDHHIDISPSIPLSGKNNAPHLKAPGHNGRT